jgi:uncharacterized protein YndB with AHSA1/START domain
MSDGDTGSIYGVIEAVHEVRIDAPPARVWQTITQRLGEWWPRDFYARPDSSGFSIDARPGGLLLERSGAGDSEGVVWGTVTALRTGSHLEYVGDLDADFGGPSRVRTRYVLTPEGNGTRVRVTEVHHGRVSPDTKRCAEEGWTHLLDECLRPFVEGVRP